MISINLMFLFLTYSGLVLGMRIGFLFKETEYVDIKFQDAMLKGTRLSNGIFRFLNIPFAKPPVGELRFKPPLPIGRLSNKLDATRMGKMCMQQTSMFGPLRDADDDEQSEDCLTLNIWTPQITGSGLLPVMVWIYGGSFSSGSAQEPRYDGEEIFKQYNDLVFVSINYRVGVMGFLGGELLQQEGSLNLGLLDQKLALEWVRDNIQAFGGDPNRITVAGESAGAMSISAHLLAQSDKQLFQQAMLLSGPPQIHYPTTKENQREFELVASTVSCPTKEGALTCLRGVDAYKLRNAGNMIEQYKISLDDNYITQQSLISLLDVKKFTKIPLLIHVNEDEGSVFSLLVRTNRDFKFFRRRYFHFLSKSQNEGLDVLYSQELENSPSQAAASITADIAFNCLSRAMAQVYSEAGQKVFKVQNKHINREITAVANMVVDLGVYHTSELPHLFQQYSLVSGVLERKFSLALQRRYLDFVRAGSPGWEDYASSGEKRFDIENNVMEDDLDDPYGRCKYLIESAQDIARQERQANSSIAQSREL